MSYKVAIGLEIHIELKTQSKMFCSCKNDPDEKRPNFNICPICTAQPGTLPVINKEAVKKVIKTGLSLNCTIPDTSKFDRKNYFYPDLPKGYQISQYDAPFCKKGYLEIPGFDENKDAKKSQIPNPKSQTNPKSKISKFKKIRITRVHLEEDTGRLLHPEGADYSLVDFNRAGIPLMELVTEPDIESGLQARRFGEELQLVLKYLGVSDADMEKGQMRLEVNISLSKSKKLGTKVEIKNLNSFKSVERAIDYEIKRQEEILKKSEKIVQETRGWDDAKGITFSQRTKEEAHDYRYFPEPDLPTLHFDKKFLRDMETDILELPYQKRERFKKEYGLDEKSIEVFVSQKDLSEYFEKTVSEFEPRLAELKLKPLVKTTANYLITDVLGMLKGGEFVEKNFKITPENFAELINLIKEEQITSKTAKEILVEMANTGVDPSHVIDSKGLVQVSDESEIEKTIKEVIKQNPKAVEDYKAGKQNTSQFLVGRVMAATRGRAKPEIVQKLLKQLLS